MSVSESSAIFSASIHEGRVAPERGPSTRITFALCDWLLSNPPWDMCDLKITRDELPME